MKQQYKDKKISLWKEYNNMTQPGNPWNEVHKLVSGKTRNKTAFTTLVKSEGTHTTGTEDTMRLMLKHFTPTDDDDDNEY